MAGPLEGLRYKGVGIAGREGAFSARVSSSRVVTTSSPDGTRERSSYDGTRERQGARDEEGRGKRWREGKSERKGKRPSVPGAAVLATSWGSPGP